VVGCRFNPSLPPRSTRCSFPFVPALSGLGTQRVATGYDVHAFGPGDAVILCGVRIPHQKKLVGHSDADVGMHALTDALLASRSTSVIGFREPVDAPIASLVYFVLYTHLVDEGRDPADAVSAVRRWLADPHRTPPEHLPSWYEAILDGGDLSGLAARDALVLHGR